MAVATLSLVLFEIWMMDEMKLQAHPYTSMTDYDVPKPLEDLYMAGL